MKWDKMKIDKWMKTTFGDSDSVTIFSERHISETHIINFGMSEVDDKAISNLIRNLTPSITLGFFDYYHPQLSDPGAYVTVHKTVDENYVYRLGNHGWTSDINASSFMKIKRYLIKNLKYNFQPELGFKLSLNFKMNEPIVSIDEEDVREDRISIIDHGFNELKLYEFNGSYLIIPDETVYSEEYIFLDKVNYRKIQIAYYLSEEYQDSTRLKNTNIISSDLIDKSVKVKLRLRN